jgi:hypothetical protein
VRNHVVVLSFFCASLCVAAARPTAAWSVLADEPKLTAEKAKGIANAFLKERKVDWGDPVRVEERDGGFWVIYPTDENEIKLVSWRTVIVSADGKAKFLPRR